MSDNRLAIDVGGTFIDFVHFDEAKNTVTIEKVLSSGKLEERFFEGIDLLKLNLSDLQMIIHGSTLVINTILQEKGAHIGLITTQGFRDVLELGRGNRLEIYNLFYKPPPPLVPRYLRCEVPERMNWKGEVLEPLDEESARQQVLQLRQHGVEGIAICFLHAYINPAHELRMAEIAAEVFPEAYIAISSNITREWREFERTSTTVLNVYTMPKMGAYLSALNHGLRERDYRGSFNIMQSSGGMTSSIAAQERPIRSLESGPAGGVIGASALGDKLGQANLVSADVGGTTFDVSLIIQGRPLKKSETLVDGRPVLQPTIDIMSIGAGGGSIAWLDEEGGLRIGPKSAEADPGPACYGLGGQEPTVTDAQLILGYLDPNYYLGQRMVLDRTAAELAVQSKVGDPLGMSLIEAAHGLVHLTVMNMTNAIRNITIERGHDPREFSLFCYGGGGGLFAGALMRELEMAQAIIPLNPATFSAWGLLNSDFREDLQLTSIVPLSDLTADELRRRLATLESEARDRLKVNAISSHKIVIEYYAELRYLGQEHTVRIPIQEDDLADTEMASMRARFHDAHERAYAHSLPTKPVELVSLHLSAIGMTQKPNVAELTTSDDGLRNALKASRNVYFTGEANPVDCPVYDREKLGSGDRIKGPAIIEEWTSTALVPPGQQLEVDRYGDLILSVD
ncbi:MAG: hydantoinase/oxoprolinase family protein [Chloroflexi bacterium]|nr:hydantoinase/oxoprolinase family protein [Chloroflexota bacterium]